MRRELRFSVGYQSNMKVLYCMICILVIILAGLGAAGMVVGLTNDSAAMRVFLLINSGLLVLFSLWLARFVVIGFRALKRDFPAAVLDKNGFRFLPMLHTKYVCIPLQDIAQVSLENNMVAIYPRTRELMQKPAKIPSFAKPFYNGKPIRLPELTEISSNDLASLLNKAMSGEDFAKQLEPLAVVMENRYYVQAKFWYNTAMLVLILVLLGGLVASEITSNNALRNTTFACFIVVYIISRLFMGWIDANVPTELRLLPDTIQIENVRSRSRTRRTYQTKSLDLNQVSMVNYLRNGFRLAMKNGDEVLVSYLRLQPNEWRKLKEAFGAFDADTERKA